MYSLTYRLSGWIYKQATTGNAYLDLGDVAGEPSLHATSTNTWVSVSGLWNSGTYTQVVVRLVTDGGINGAVWFDEVALTPLHKVTSTAYYAAGGQTVAVRRQLSAASAPSGAGELSYLHTDHLGSSSTTTDASGNVTARQSYYPYGGVRQQVGTLPTRRTYTGQYADAGTGLMFYNARYYAPALGRFISADSLVPGAGNPQAFNRYMYVLGNPVKLTDPSGHDPCTGIPGTYMPDCGVDGWGLRPGNRGGGSTPRQTVQPGLTPPGSKFQQTRPYGGSEVKTLFDKMMAETSGWWHTGGSFNLETFVGLMIMHEAAGQAEFATWVATAVAQQLFVGGNRPPYCPSGPCVNGVFNFLAAYSESVHRLIDSYVRGAISIMKYSGYGGFARSGEAEIQRRLGEATAWGNQALHPASLISDRYYAPTDWGNFSKNLSLNRPQVTVTAPTRLEFLNFQRQ